MSEAEQMARVALVMASITRANVKIAAMVALNDYRKMRGETIAYDDAAFFNIIDEEALGENQIITTLKG